MTDSEVDTDAPTDAPAGGDDDFTEGTFNDWLGLSEESTGDGRAVLSVDCDRFRQNSGGILHGGVTATLIDVAGGRAIGTTFDDERPRFATTNLEVNYLRPVTDTAFATAETVRVGGTTAVAHVEVESTAPDGERKRVAIGTVTYHRS